MSNAILGLWGFCLFVFLTRGDFLGLVPKNEIGAQGLDLENGSLTEDQRVFPHIYHRYLLSSSLMISLEKQGDSAAIT